ncbi:gag-pol polyprotein [Dermatophagoides farinae]|uniref:Gag-pol polyprotein n=1 Tax=Dermatophagoides farinae TaxID=6954 RepID=A0A9D4P850_DERFA|nr:gag-pol polyprotein [Dermatophagoides farinae]
MGTEFRSELFQNYLSGHGIIHEKASVNTPQQNGRCERAMRTPMDHAISMLLSTDLPRFLWDEAVNCSAYLMNLVLNSRNEIPYESILFVRMIGYEGQTIYRVYVSGARRVELCSSVDFDEKPKCCSAHWFRCQQIDYKQL